MVLLHSDTGGGITGLRDTSIPCLKSKNEIIHLVENTEGRFEVSRVWPDEIGYVEKEVRISETAPVMRDEIVRRIEERALKIVSWRNNSTNLQRLKVQRYGFNGYYTFHYDWDGDSKEGSRMTTFMVYLNDNFTRGGANFPKLEQTSDQRWCEVILCAGDEDYEDYPGVTFRPVAGSVWGEAGDEREAHKDEFVGYLLMDLLWRPGKYKGSQNVTLQCGYLKDDGTRVYPATILMCCFPRATAAPCPLLEHRQIVSLFHELGHGIHDLMSRTSYTAFHGHRVPTDFGEAPSVMLENWCWLKDELQKMSCHYTKLDPKYLKEWQETHGDQPLPDNLPDAILDGLVRSRDLNRALWFLHQLACARFDMAVHHPPNHQSCEEIDPASVYNDFMEHLMCLPHPNPIDRGHPHADFGHVVSGYDAGYYSYLSAHVFAADPFHTAFAQDPCNQTTWEDYRRGILEPGGSKDELKMLETFLGHAPDPSVLLETFGPA